MSNELHYREIKPGDIVRCCTVGDVSNDEFGLVVEEVDDLPIGRCLNVSWPTAGVVLHREPVLRIVLKGVQNVG